MTRCQSITNRFNVVKATMNSLFFAVCAFHSVAMALKECTEPTRFSSMDQLTCTSDFALVPEEICHNANKDCRHQQKEEGSDVCAVVVEALFADWRMMDGAFLLSGACLLNPQREVLSS